MNQWHRLSSRIIWVDLAISILSILPAVLAIWLFDVDSSQGQIWPLIGLAVFGVAGAYFDALRWAFTRFRITPSHVELKTGIVFRQHRSIKRDRIRSVDVETKLRHRVARMRVVTIGAGQQAAAGESALALDALSAEDAQELQHALLDEANDEVELGGQNGQLSHGDEPLRVFARFEPSWVIYNIFNIWAYVFALGLGWGAIWLLSTVGIDLYGFAVGLLDWDSIGWAGTALIVLAGAGIFGAFGLAVTYFLENWNFELARVRGRDGTMLRTRKGLLTTREVNRAENRFRGAQISQPVLWRWMGTTDTSVLTTGLDVYSMNEPAAILPRGPLRRATEVAGQVLGDPHNPFHTELAAHPRAALRRRLWWATGLAALLVAVLFWLAHTGVLPDEAIWAVGAFWPVAILAAVVAYRALGHTITDRYVITRSGLFSRATTVLQRSAVSTIVIRESVLQRRLGLQTVSTMTAAGHGGYDTPDISRDESLQFAVQAAPGLLDPFLVPTELVPTEIVDTTRET